jgi:cytidylate kinase
MSADRPPPAVVTIAALYGAGGTVIGPRVAQRLGVPYLDREVPQAVARKTGLSEAAVADVDEEPRSGVERLVANLGRAGTVSGAMGGSLERLDLQERDIRGQIEEFLARSAGSGGVTLGRGSMVVLAAVPHALHVHLGGPREARIQRRMALDGIDRQTAERRQELTDRTRIGYVRRAYGVDGEDPALYHLMLDSTALGMDACVEIIVAASEARRSRPERKAIT